MYSPNLSTKRKTDNIQILGLQSDALSTNSVDLKSADLKTVPNSINSSASKCISICDSVDKSQLSMYTSTDFGDSSLAQMVFIGTIGNKEKREEADKRNQGHINEVSPVLVIIVRQALQPVSNAHVLENM